MTAKSSFRACDYGFEARRYKTYSMLGIETHSKLFKVGGLE
jgi:hypothetical protein